MKIAHFSDLHFRINTPGSSAVPARRSREVIPLLEKALRRAVEDHQVDLIAVTGDIVDAPDFLVDRVPKGFQMEELEAWKEAVRKDYLLFNELLEATKVPYLVLPGNHDLEKILFEVFPPSERPTHIQQHRLFCFDDYEHEGNIPRRFYPSRERFEEALEGADNSPQVHFQHYLLRPIASGGYPYHYLEHESLCETLEKSGKVRLCLSGHYHWGTEIHEHGGTHYAVTPAFCDAPHRWRIYTLQPESIEYQEFSEPTPRPTATVYLDRDGVINDLASYWFGPEEFRLIPGSAEAIRKLNERCIRTVVVTSQSCAGLGYVSEAVLKMVHEQMNALLHKEGAHLDAIYYTKGAGERSIVPGWKELPTQKSTLLFSAKEALDIDLSNAWIVGDRLSDMQAGEEAGIHRILVQTGDGASEALLNHSMRPFPVVPNLAAAVDLILATLDPGQGEPLK